LISLDLDKNAEASKYLNIASSEIERISKLVMQLRDLYRTRGPDHMQSVGLPELLETIHLLVEPQLVKRRVIWEILPNHGDLNVWGSKDQLKQVFLNLSINSIEAMQASGGKIQISFIHDLNLSRVAARIQDTGPGIQPDYLDKIYDPFFTTKTSGTGLGLAITYDIIQKHGGRIEVQSEVGRGTVFTVWLPQVSGEGGINPLNSLPGAPSI
jgi:signal transduction histidine kinase